MGRRKTIIARLVRLRRPRPGKLCLPVFAALALSTVALPALAQQTTQSPPPAAVLPSALLTIEQDLLYGSTLFGRALEQALNTEREALVLENQAIFDALSSEESALAEIRADTDPEIFSTLAQEFDRRVQSIRATQDNKLRALIQKRESAQQMFLNRILPLVAEVARSRGALAVIERRSVFLSVQSIDITEAAIAFIDAEIGDGSPLIPPALSLPSGQQVDGQGADDN